MFHVFNVIPTGFFNNLSSGSISRGRYVETLQYMLDNNCKLEHHIKNMRGNLL